MAVHPGAYNTYVADTAASNGLIIDFARNPKDFAVNSYMQMVPVKKMQGLYIKMTVEQAGRLLSSPDSVNFLWPDGADEPTDRDGSESFTMKSFLTQRRRFGFRFGDLTIGQSSWDLVRQHTAIFAQLAMTVRTQEAIGVATNPTNHDPQNIIDVPTLAGTGGGWASSTTARLSIKKSLNEARIQIAKATLQGYRGELILVISEQMAAALSETQEIVDYIKGSPDAIKQVRGDAFNRNSKFDLPEKLYGFEVIVEDTYKITNRKGAARAVSSVMPDATPFVCARPGGIEGVHGGPSFSSLQCFTMEEMKTEVMHDKNNRVTKGRIVENYVTKLVSPATTVLFTNAL